MVSQGIANSMLVLRIIALAASVATIPLVITNNVKFDDLLDGIELELTLKFQYIMAFRYVLAVAAISAMYGIIQLPFAVYYAVKQKRLIRNGCLPDFDFIGDKVISLLLATAIGAGIAVSYESKRGLQNSKRRFEENLLIPNTDLILTLIKHLNKFFDRGIIASSILALACLCLAIVSVISSINRNRSKGFFN
ncbi:CASP-like protein 4D1 [Prosopis cineraria]|uniref:CASP-like protein 4D1 n=1 Tax=Prosopis cineraria TaxID=364024 RepID=UPI002410AB68|nr:CASP-like protein 4D1 [Prosopis cineraria]